MASTDGGLRKIFRDELRRGFHWTTIETGAVSSGVPDAHYAHETRRGWVEYKQTSAWAVKIRPAQIGWVRAYQRHGGMVTVAVRRKHGGGPRLGEPTDELWLYRGGAIEDLRDHGLGAEECVWGLMGVERGGPSHWGWGRVASHLLRRKG